MIVILAVMFVAFFNQTALEVRIYLYCDSIYIKITIAVIFVLSLPYKSNKVVLLHIEVFCVKLHWIWC